MENGTKNTFSGQFQTALNVQGKEVILATIQAVWASVNAETMAAYLKQIGQTAQDIKMAVIIQVMVQPVVYYYPTFIRTWKRIANF